MEITTLEDLQAHLGWAIEVEHSTIPPYLCALFSIEDQTSAAATLIRSVVLEEMLHMAIACNLLNAVGGAPALSDPSFVPPYPRGLPHHSPEPPLTIHLERCSIDLVAGTFMAIEKPETAGDPPEGDDYTSLGQLYAAITKGFETLNRTLGPQKLFTGSPARQVTSEVWRGSDIFEVKDLATATKAIEEIVEQGEGTSQSEYDAEHELAHYWKFNQIVDGTIPLGVVFPTIPDPGTAKLPPGSLRALSQLFNDCYCLLLRCLERVFNGAKSTPLVEAMFALMTEVLPGVAGVLVRTPIPAKGVTASPSFEFSSTAQSEIVAECKALLGAYPQLNAAFEALQGLAPIDDAGVAAGAV
jgi:Ferritin-like